MSVNDGLSDDEWGAWGKNQNAVSLNVDDYIGNKNSQNGFGSDGDEITFNIKPNKIDNNTASDETNGRVINKNNFRNNSFNMNKDGDCKLDKKASYNDEKSISKVNDFKGSRQENYRRPNFQTSNYKQNENGFSNNFYSNENNYEENNNRKEKYGNRRDFSGNLESYQNNNYRDKNGNSHKNNEIRETRNKYSRDDSLDMRRSDYNFRDKDKSLNGRDHSPDNRKRHRKREDSEDLKRHNSRDKRRDFKRDDFLDNETNYKKDDSRNNRRNYERDDSRSNRKNYKRESSRDYQNGYSRDDSRDNRRNYKRGNSRDYQNDYKRDNSGGNRRNYKRDDSRDNRRNYKRDDSRGSRRNYKRDDSRDNRRNYKRDNSRDNRRNYKRDDSRGSRRNYKRDHSRGHRRNESDSSESRRDFNRDYSHEGRRNYKMDYSAEERRNFNSENSWDTRRKDCRKTDGFSGCQKKNLADYDGDSSDDRNRRESNNFLYKERDRTQENGVYEKRRADSNRSDSHYRSVIDNFERTVNLNNSDEKNEENYSSRTFTRSNNNNPEKFNDNKEVTEPEVIPKRATFVPNDDQADYELHVNSGINFDNYDKIPVEVTGENIPVPLNSIGDLQLSEFLQNNIKSFFKYEKLTPIQKYSIPIIRTRRDLMACAQTGSGKTAAFLIPIIEALHAESIVPQVIENDGETIESIPTCNESSLVAFPKALIMAPTRELCRQIFTVCRSFCKDSNLKCTYIYGGIEMNRSRRNIQTMGCDILVATPGRLIHFLELVWISLRHLKFFVLDEADRMLDAEGFYESISKIYAEANCCGDDRTIQISMFSATFPNEIQQLAGTLLNNYLFVAVGVVGSVNNDVLQEVMQVEHREKVNMAIDYIKKISDEKTLIFVDTKRMADFFGIKLGALGFKVTTIHGDRDQEQRESALNEFKSGRVNIMVATNVAARGLDIPLVDNVINIDLPEEIDTYVHRIGRTGRCGNVGRAISFFDESKDIGLVSDLVNKLREANQECPDWLLVLVGNCSLVPGRVAKRNNKSVDNRKNVSVNKYMENSNNGFIDEDDQCVANGNGVVCYDDVKETSEWLED